MPLRVISAACRFAKAASSVAIAGPSTNRFEDVGSHPTGERRAGGHGGRRDRADAGRPNERTVSFSHWRPVMAMLPTRRSGGRNVTLVNPSREFEDIYDRM